MEIGNTNISSNNELNNELDNDDLIEKILPFEFDYAYKGDEATKRAAEIIDMKDLTGWSIIDTHENLALLHYNPKANMTKFGHIRGILVDLENGDIIANSFGYTPTTISNEIVPTDDNTIDVVDTDGVNHVFPLLDENVHIKQVFEGVVIRVIWYGGKMYRITHKKINPVRSRWGTSKRFITAYEEAKGPTADQLFDTTKPYSSTCYHFLVVDNSLLVGTRQKMSVPYVVYIEKQKMTLQRPDNDIAEGVPTFPLFEKISGTVTKPGIYKPRELSINSANRFLKFGYYIEPVQSDELQELDDRQSTGESVIIYRKVDEIITDVIKVNSKSYEWRSNLRGGKPNIKYQFFSRSTMVHAELKDDQTWEKLKSELILFPLYSVDELKSLHNEIGVLMIPIQKDHKPTKELYNSRISRLHLFWINYVLSLPINHQKEALNLLDDLHTDRNNLVPWLCTLEMNVKDINENDYNKYIVRIITYARKEAKTRVKNGTNISAKGEIVKEKKLISNLIFKLINKEKGESLYSMIREMKTQKST